MSGKPIRIKDGRFGVYVTDGTTNATIPRGEDVAAIDFDRAVELLADKRAKGPAAPRASARKATPAKAAAKTPAKAKAATKTPVKAKAAAKPAAKRAPAKKK